MGVSEDILPVKNFVVAVSKFKLSVWRLNKVTREFGMKINVKRTKVMCISRKGNNKLKIYVDRQKVEQVSQFKYFSSLISEDG